MEPQNKVPTPAVATPATSTAKKALKVVGIVAATVVVIFALLAWYGFYLEKHGLVPTTPTGTLTAQQIQKLQATANDPSGDYFTGSPAEQAATVKAFVADNSKSDSTYLFLAANTAYRINDLKDAAFLFYAAQMRKEFDYKRYGLGGADGSDIQTYLGFLNETVGDSVNPAIVRSPQDFFAAADMLDSWQVQPADDAYYPSDSYGSYALPKDQWPAVAAQVKQDYTTNFLAKNRVLLGDPKNLAAITFVQDYNFGKIPHTPENTAEFQAYSKQVEAILGN